MNKIVLYSAFCFLTFIPFKQSVAAQFSGDYLLQMCAMDRGGNELVEGGAIACQAYLSGILDYHKLLHSLDVAPAIDFCVPKDISLNILQLRVASYLRNNKHEQGPFIASPGVAMALHKMYPCR